MRTVSVWHTSPLENKRNASIFFFFFFLSIFSSRYAIPFRLNVCTTTEYNATQRFECILYRDTAPCVNRTNNHTHWRNGKTWKQTEKETRWNGTMEMGTMRKWDGIITCRILCSSWYNISLYVKPIQRCKRWLVFMYVRVTWECVWRSHCFDWNFVNV